MWDPPTCNLVRLFEPEDFHSNLPKRQFFRYVPLVHDGQYITGITFYWRPMDPYQCELIGFGTRFDKEECVCGSANGIPVYFPLAPNERIAFIWVRRPRPALTVRGITLPHFPRTFQDRNVCLSIPANKTMITDFHYHWKMSYSWTMCRPKRGSNEYVRLGGPSKKC